MRKRKVDWGALEFVALPMILGLLLVGFMLGCRALFGAPGLIASGTLIILGAFFLAFTRPEA